MNHAPSLPLITAAIIAVIALPQPGHTQVTHVGTVERVWDDGFRLQTSEQTLWVDASDLYNNTPGHITVGDQVSVSGNFDRIEFDAAAIADAVQQE